MEPPAAELGKNGSVDGSPVHCTSGAPGSRVVQLITICLWAPQTCAHTEAALGVMSLIFCAGGRIRAKHRIGMEWLGHPGHKKQAWAMRGLC